MRLGRLRQRIRGSPPSRGVGGVEQKPERKQCLGNVGRWRALPPHPAHQLGGTGVESSRANDGGESFAFPAPEKISGIQFREAADRVADEADPSERRKCR